MIRIILALTLLASPAAAKGFPDGSTLSTTDMAQCSAAALKIDKELWLTWHAALKTRYSIIYKDKSQKEIDNYTIERVMDKKRALERNGFLTKPGFQLFYKQNCEGQLNKGHEQAEPHTFKTPYTLLTANGTPPQITSVLITEDSSGGQIITYTTTKGDIGFTTKEQIMNYDELKREIILK